MQQLSLSPRGYDSGFDYWDRGKGAAEGEAVLDKQHGSSLFGEKG